MPSKYEQLKAEKNKLVNLLAENANLAGHSSYLQAEKRLADIRLQIKGLFKVVPGQPRTK